MKSQNVKQSSSILFHWMSNLF